MINIYGGGWVNVAATISSTGLEFTVPSPGIAADSPVPGENVKL
jgi:hypothetical protein